MFITAHLLILVSRCESVRNASILPTYALLFLFGIALCVSQEQYFDTSTARYVYWSMIGNSSSTNFHLHITGFARGGCTQYHAWRASYNHRPSHLYNAGTEQVGFSPTRQTLHAPSAKCREVFRESHARRVTCILPRTVGRTCMWMTAPMRHLIRGTIVKRTKYCQ